MDVALQRHRMAVVEMQTERVGVELVEELAARRDLLVRVRSVHRRRVPAVEVERVRVAPLVDEPDAHEVALGGADRRTRNLAVEGPGREEDAGGDLDLAVGGEDLVLAQERAVGARRLAVEARALLLRKLGEVPAAQVAVRIEDRLVDRADDAEVLVAGMRPVPVVSGRGPLPFAVGAAGGQRRGEPRPERADAGGAEDRTAGEGFHRWNPKF